MSLAVLYLSQPMEGNSLLSKVIPFISEWTCSMDMIFLWKCLCLSIVCSWQFSLKTQFMTTARRAESIPKSSCSCTLVIKCLRDSVFWRLSSFTEYFSSVKIRICYPQHLIETRFYNTHSVNAM